MFGPEGLLVGFNLSFWQLFIGYLLLTPVAMYIIAPVLESRLLPLSLRRQFASFLIGDVLLAFSAAALSVFNRKASFVAIPLVVIIGLLMMSVAVAIKITYGEWQASKRGDKLAYAPRAVLSPTKLYHNLLLYGGYGWIMLLVIAQAGLQVFTEGASVAGFSLALLPAAGWLAVLVLESTLSSKETTRRRAEHAHVANWRFCWR